jgi:hypothetical protein
MSHTITVHVDFDPDARVWFVERSDVHGLRIEAATIEELVDRIPGAIQDLLDDGDSVNGHDVPVEVIAHRSTSVRLDA